jgi:hypothetical protein
MREAQVFILPLLQLAAIFNLRQRCGRVIRFSDPELRLWSSSLPFVLSVAAIAAAMGVMLCDARAGRQGNL